LNQALEGVKFSSALEAAVMKGLERDLNKRWKTVEDFTKAFVEAATGEPQADQKKAGGLFSKLFGRKE
jgi:hypothetical protein